MAGIVPPRVLKVVAFIISGKNLILVKTPKVESSIKSEKTTPEKKSETATPSFSSFLS